MQDKEEVKKREERFMKKGLFSRGLFFTMMLVFVLVLAACSEKEAATPAPASNTEEGKTEEKPANEEGVYSIDDFNNVKTNEGTAIEGGSITFGLVSDTAFEGTLNYNFYSGNPDVQVLQWFDEPLLTWDKDYVYTNDGAATYETSEDGKTFTLTIRDNVNWHDGKP